MSTRNRGFLTAVIGFLIFAGVLWFALRPTYPEIGSYEYAEQTYTNYRPGGPDCHPARLNRLEGGEAANERYRCQEAAEEHRLKSDDLVQQTRSADAAESIVSLTYNQSLMLLTGTIIGLLTLFAAGFAAWYAKRAAEAAEKGLAHAKDTTATELRPWISVSMLPRKVCRTGKALSFEYDIIVHNHGQTVGRGYQLNLKLIFPQPNEPYADAVRRQWNEWKAPEAIGRAAIMPGEDDVFPSWGHFAMDTLPWGPEQGGCRMMTPVVAVSVFYRSAFDEDWHRTDRAFTIGRKGETLIEEYIRDNVSDLGPEHLVARPVSMSLAT